MFGTDWDLKEGQVRGQFQGTPLDHRVFSRLQQMYLLMASCISQFPLETLSSLGSEVNLCRGAAKQLMLRNDGNDKVITVRRAEWRGANNYNTGYEHSKFKLKNNIFSFQLLLTTLSRRKSENEMLGASRQKRFIINHLVCCFYRKQQPKVYLFIRI